MYVFCFQESLSSDGLIIVDVGVLAVRSSEDVDTQYLIDGDYFGEISLVTDGAYRSPSVVAMISCKVNTFFVMDFLLL